MTIAVMLTLLTALAAPLVLAQQPENVGYGEPKVGDNSLQSNMTGLPSPYYDTGFLQYAPPQEGVCRYDFTCDSRVVNNDIFVPGA